MPTTALLDQWHVSLREELADQDGHIATCSGEGLDRRVPHKSTSWCSTPFGNQHLALAGGHLCPSSYLRVIAREATENARATSA